MKLAVIGTGYVGLVTGTCFAELGYHVTCVDIDEKKIADLQQGIIPIYEPGLEDLVKRNAKEERLIFTTDAASAISTADIVFSAVGTPPDKDHKADLRFVREVAKTFAENLSEYRILVTKSTVPVGTNQECEDLIQEVLKERGVEVEFDVVSNPEFLREGCAIYDTMSPDRIVVGTTTERARKMMEKLYKPLTSRSKDVSVVFTSRPSAEVIKYAANSFLATKISFINEVANFCERTGADVTEVAKGIGLDKRIGGRFLQAGIGYGGSCFPKDVQALIQKGHEVDCQFHILEAVEDINQQQRHVPLHKLKHHFGDLSGKTFAIWGLSFKPKTDDIRCAPALNIIEELLKDGAQIQCFDPVSSEGVKELFGDRISYCTTPYQATQGAHALLLLTEWDEFRNLDYDDLRNSMSDAVIFDGRNIYSPEEVEEEGFTYLGIGRPSNALQSSVKKPRLTVNESTSQPTQATSVT